MSVITHVDVLARYNQKAKDYCGGFDPYNMKSEKKPLPRNVGYFDVYNYCIGKDSAFTHDSFRAYKSLQTFQYFENGWVQSIDCKKITTGFIIVSKVKHSFRLSWKALRCWVAIDSNGIILTAHCECMAGLGEVCTHVGAVLFVLEAWNRKSTEIDRAESISCTDVLAKWLVPKLKEVIMASVADICWNPVPEVVTHDSVDNTSIAITDPDPEDVAYYSLNDT
ncbi:hypothetical protein Bhyg_03159 [Pseudolycoriella hygida]|uniref:SWIM-type domain-containing protein n=1 Tax=Pseudolycoriella hygida TaxID=35572 RepID=A0A9Q0S798_9DIPT|nr:hypothetical protein Bhyg_03159 [Pseudolycoriella hygida]